MKKAERAARTAACGSSLQRIHLVQRHLPLPQADADHRQVALVIDAHDAPGLIEARHAHRVVRLEPPAGLAQRGRLLRLALRQ